MPPLACAAASARSTKPKARRLPSLKFCSALPTGDSQAQTLPRRAPEPREPSRSGRRARLRARSARADLPEDVGVLRGVGRLSGILAPPRLFGLSLLPLCLELGQRRSSCVLQGPAGHAARHERFLSFVMPVARAPGVPVARSEAMARQMAKATAGAEKGGRGPGSAAKPAGAAPATLACMRGSGTGQAKVAGKEKPALVAKKPAEPAKPKSAPEGQTPEELAKRNRDAQFRALVDPKAQDARKQQHLEAFRKLQMMSMEDLQVEFIVCIRAEHYKDALMYSEILLEKDPSNVLVAQFQPLLASMAVQANERLCESSDSDSDGEDGDDGVEGEDQGEEEGNNAKEESDSDSDDPETAWMWSDTWRTDPDDDQPVPVQIK